MEKVFDFILEDLAAVRKRQCVQVRFNRRILIFSLAVFAASEFRARKLQTKYEELSAELKEIKQSKGE